VFKEENGDDVENNTAVACTGSKKQTSASTLLSKDLRFGEQKMSCFKSFL